MSQAVLYVEFLFHRDRGVIGGAVASQEHKQDAPGQTGTAETVEDHGPTVPAGGYEPRQKHGDHSPEGTG